MANVSGPTARFDFLDYIKGVLIFLVVYGHVIQFIEYKNSDLFWYNPVYKIIYMFHMPLFMAISGFVSYNSIQKKSFAEIFSNRIRTLIIPIVFFGLFDLIVGFLLGETVGLKQLPILIVKSIIGNLWFLWALFFATVITSFMRKYNLDKPLFFLFALIFFLLLPNPYDTSLYKFTFFYFLIGYGVAQRSIHTHKFFSGNNKFFMVICLVLSVVFFFLWDKKMYVYTSGMKILSMNVLIVLFRYIVGVVVSIAFSLLFLKVYALYGSSQIIQLGKNSIYIYILQDIVFSILKFMQFPKYDSVFFTFFAAPIIALVIVFMSYYIGEFSQRWKLMRIAFGRYNKVVTNK